ncbi:hypothetical protein M2E15_2241 [Bacillus mycoides]|nr:hypothetical protein M2E15_2241 [Bacillus mycoides]
MSPVWSEIIDIAPAFAVGMGKEFISPVAFILPIRFPFCSVNHNAPSFPTAIPYGPESISLTTYSCIVILISFPPIENFESCFSV